MRVALLTRAPELHSTRRLLEAGRRRGHEMLVLDYTRCLPLLSETGPRLLLGAEPVPAPEVVVPRFAGFHAGHGVAVVRQLEAMGARSVNPAEAIDRARDKLRCLQLLAAAGLPVPVTGGLPRAGDPTPLLRALGGTPLLVKRGIGGKGRGVVLALGAPEARALGAAFGELDGAALLQHFHEEAQGEDLRCFVVGGELRAAMLRTAAPEEFRSNLSRGGSGQAARPTEEERALAEGAARRTGLGVAGVDLLRARRGPLVLEVNSCPGLEGIEEATGVDLADAILALAESWPH